MEQQEQSVHLNNIGYVIGKWNPNKNICEYLGPYGSSWVNNIEDAKIFPEAPPSNTRLKSLSGNKREIIFISKMFITRTYWYNGNFKGFTNKGLTKPNHWQKLEAMMQI